MPHSFVEEPPHISPTAIASSQGFKYAKVGQLLSANKSCRQMPQLAPAQETRHQAKQRAHAQSVRSRCAVGAQASTGRMRRAREGLEKAQTPPHRIPAGSQCCRHRTVLATHHAFEAPASQPAQSGRCGGAGRGGGDGRGGEDGGEGSDGGDGGDGGVVGGSKAH